MALSNSPVFLSSFLLERNRWNGKGPSLLVSEWMEPIAEAGFRGLEIWAPHLFLSSRSEWEAIRETSQASDLPVAFLQASLPTDASDKSSRQRDFLMEATDYFEPQGIKFAAAEGPGKMDERAAFIGEWARDLSREVALVPTFENGAWDPVEMRKYREPLAGRFRCSLNPFALGVAKAERWFKEAGDLAVNLGVRLQNNGKCDSLRSADTTCADLAALLRRLDFKGSWTLETTQGVGAPGEDIDSLFDEAEEDLNFLLAALGRK